MQEKRVELWTKNKNKVIHCKQQSTDIWFSYLFEHPDILLHVRDASGTSLWSTCPMRGKNGGVRAVLPAESPESSYCTRGATFDEKQTARRALVTLPHSRGVGVLFDEVWVVYISTRDEELMNSSLLRWCSWLLSIFYHARGCVIWAYHEVPPWYKNPANVTPQLKVAPVA
jgi:hypothetical protein